MRIASEVLNAILEYIRDTQVRAHVLAGMVLRSPLATEFHFSTRSTAAHCHVCGRSGNASAANGSPAKSPSCRSAAALAAAPRSVSWPCTWRDCWVIHR